ncbi:MAG: 1-acyl-sn-glycerol-3-phosphate acyltransferase [Planctomycetota bacterium]
MGATYRVIRAWARLLVATWYRTSFTGAPLPEDAPCILVVNHSNGLCDGHFQLAVTPRPVRVLAKFRLFEIPVLGWLVKNTGAIPVYRKKDGVDTTRNALSFRAIHEALAAGDVIAIFPEGESRGTPYLRELKTGAARMALGAEEAAEWRAGIRIVPVGITYEDIDRFRSRAEAWIGESFAVHDSIDAWNHSPILAGRALTQRIGQEMRALSLQVPPGDDMGESARALACAVERLMPPSDEPLAKRRQDAWDRFERLRARDPEGHARRVEAALQLDQNLRTHRLTTREVFEAHTPSPLSLIGELTLRGVLGVPALALCAVAWGPPVLIARLVARHGASTPDKFVTVTLLMTFAGMLLWLPLLAWLLIAQVGGTLALVLFSAVTLGAATLTRAFDNLAAMRRLFGRTRLAGDKGAKARLAETLTKFGALLEKA